MYSQLGNRVPFVAPPLPHQPQGHFYDLPDLNLGQLNGHGGGITAGEGGYYCGFDTLSMAGDDPSKSAENVLLVGCQGGIDIFRVEKKRLDLVGRLEGLTGAVLGAKILPWTSRTDPYSTARPLIALVIHGPAKEEVRTAHSGSGSSSVIDDSSESPSRPASSKENYPTSKVDHFQTTVEVYSLKEKRLVAVLYQSPLIPITQPIESPVFEPPAPVGDFVVDAKGKFVVVGSGASGEIFIFSPRLRSSEGQDDGFHCIGKVWTAVRFRERASHSSASSAAESSQEEAALEEYGIPIFSLSDRWLAVAPPASTTLYAVNGIARTSSNYVRPPGLAHHTVPPQPSPNCAVEAPETTGFIDRLAREGTQVAIKGARWATEKGIQAFKSYMNKGAPVNGTYNGGVPSGNEPIQPWFPPTHGHNHTQPRQEAAVISVYDLQRFLDAEDNRSKHALHPLATIPASLGCSFLSFAPSGLMLMTVSSKGDFQDVWDMKPMNFRKARKTAREQTSGAHVRQVARFARMTVANVVDVVWSAPRPARLAVITDKGTVHMFPMPASAFQWPPARRIRKTGPSTKAKEEAAGGGRGGPISSAMNALNGTAKPFLDAVRTRSTGNGSRFPSLSSLGMTPAAGAKSGKAVAAGVGKSINNIRHAGDNKLTVPITSSGVKPGSARWLTGKCRGCIALAAGGILQIYRVKMRPATGKGKSANSTSITKKKLVEFSLATIMDVKLAPAVTAKLSRQTGEGQTVVDIHGEWLPRALPNRHSRAGPIGRIQIVSSIAPLSYSEIETNPPYQPFYTDRRGSRFKFAKLPVDIQKSDSNSLALVPELVSNLHHQSGNDEIWSFGEEVDAVRISSPAAHSYDSGDEEDIDDVAARIENKFSLREGEEDIEQVVVTTRRKRVKTQGDVEDEDGFFEDDCEVLDFAEDRV
jgi:hypothetical protein